MINYKKYMKSDNLYKWIYIKNSDVMILIKHANIENIFSFIVPLQIQCILEL